MKMKRLMMTTAVAILTAAAARADNSITTQDPDPMPVFKGNELSLDAFGAYQTVVNTPLGSRVVNNLNKSDFWGGGLGLNYYFINWLGIGGESAAFSNTKHFIDYAGGNLYARLPIQSAHFAPYIFGGGGRAFNPNWNWYVDGGAGLDFRICKNFGIFGDARYVWREIGNNDFDVSTRIHLVEARIGVRFIVF